MTGSREVILHSLRERVIRGVRSRMLRQGDRLPTAPELAREFAVDARLVTAVYRELEAEGLVECRPRGGVYVRATPDAVHGSEPLPDAWLADMLAQGLCRELPAPQLHDWVRRCLETLRLRSVVITETADQGYGLARELRDDFGLEATSLLVVDLRDVAAGSEPLPVRQADLLVTTRANEEWLRRQADRLGKPLIVIDVRPELLVGEYALLLRRPVYVVVASEEFAGMLWHFYRETSGIENLRILVLGRDDPATIPADAPAYVTQRARYELGDAPVPGRLLPPARTIATASAREIFQHVVRMNIAAMRR